jgi:hypothetical protein
VPAGGTSRGVRRLSCDLDIDPERLRHDEQTIDADVADEIIEIATKQCAG